MGIEAELCPSLFEENLRPEDFETTQGFVEETALRKVQEVYERIPKDDRETIIIGADTMVTLDGEIFGKPATNEVAFQMLKRWV